MARRYKRICDWVQAQAPLEHLHLTMATTYDSPLKGYENAEPLPTEYNPDGKSLQNVPGPKSASYSEFPKPIDSSNNGFDFHSM